MSNTVATESLLNRSRSRARQGLTLIEVLLAVAILGVGFVVLLSASVRCLAVMRAARNFQEAQWVLGRGEAQYPILEFEEIEDLNVDLETFENGFTFERVVDEDEDEDGLYAVTTRVTWSGRGYEHVEKVVQYIFFPEEKQL